MMKTQKSGRKFMPRGLNKNIMNCLLLNPVIFPVFPSEISPEIHPRSISDTLLKSGLKLKISRIFKNDDVIIMGLLSIAILIGNIQNTRPPQKSRISNYAD